MLRKLTVLTALLAVFGVVWTANASADVGIGTNSGGTLIQCGPSLTIIQTAVASAGTTFTVPSGSWVLSSWSTQANSNGGQMAAVVYRQTSPGVYTVVGVSATETLTPNVVNSFTTAISVESGDTLGFWASGGTGCGFQTANAGDVLTYYNSGGGVPSIGDTVTAGTDDTNFFLDIAGTLTSTASSVLPDHMFVCYSKWEQDGGAVFQTDQVEQLLAAGWWLPTAVPGVVDGGDNLGGYHLECNPPDSFKANGQWIDGGGRLLDQDRTTGIGWYAVKTGA